MVWAVQMVLDSDGWLAQLRRAWKVLTDAPLPQHPSRVAQSPDRARHIGRHTSGVTQNTCQLSLPRRVASNNTTNSETPASVTPKMQTRALTIAV